MLILVLVLIHGVGAVNVSALGALCCAELSHGSGFGASVRNLFDSMRAPRIHTPLLHMEEEDLPKMYSCPTWPNTSCLSPRRHRHRRSCRRHVAGEVDVRGGTQHALHGSSIRPMLGG